MKYGSLTLRGNTGLDEYLVRSCGGMTEGILLPDNYLVQSEVFNLAVKGVYTLPDDIMDLLPLEALLHDRPHYPRLTAQAPDVVMIAKKIGSDRYEMIKIGRYLRRYFPDWSPQSIDRYVKIYKGNNPGFNCTIEILEKTIDIVRVMRDEISDAGTAVSCMTGQDRYDWSRYFDTSITHPYHVYGGESGIYLAILRDKEHKIIARSLVTDNNAYSRVYGKDIGIATLKAMLQDRGYSYSDRALEGHTLNRVGGHGDYIVVPYIDGNAHYVDPETLEIGYTGYDTQDNSHYERGVIGDNRPTCDHCGHPVDEDDCLTMDDGQIFCDHTCATNGGYEYAYTGRWQEWVAVDEGDLYEYNSELYNADGLDYHDLFICQKCGDIESMDDGILNIDGEFYCSERCISVNHSLQWVAD